MSNLYQRIGEAMTSQGQITLVLALDFAEAELLRNSNFPSRGRIDLNGSILEVFDVVKTVSTVVPGTPSNDWWKVAPLKREPWQTDPWTATYTPTGTGVAPNTYNGTVSNALDAAYNPLSILDDHLFSSTEVTPRRVFKIDVNNPSHVEYAKEAIKSYKNQQDNK